MRIFLLCGEPSGDLHASLLLRALREREPSAEFRAWGGDRLQEAGAEVTMHIRELAFMGVAAVIKNLPRIFANFGKAKQDITDFKPDLIIFIDYGGFNLRMAKWAKTQGYQVFYYISPQVWASRESRVEKVRKYVDQMFCILPFEKEFYKKHGIHVEYEGHPLLDQISAPPNPEAFSTTFRQAHGLTAAPVVALLPGSRRQEVSRMLALMLETAKDFPQLQFVVAGTPALSPEIYSNIIGLFPLSNIHIVQGQTYPLLQVAHAALVTSGTATLETALHGVPQAVCYKTEPLFYAIAKRIIRVPYISIVNLILNKPAVQELIQNDCTVSNLKQALQKLLEPGRRKEMESDYALLRKLLGEKGAVGRVAGRMMERKLR